MDLGQPVADVGEPHFTIGTSLIAPPHRITVGLGDNFVDVSGQPPAGHRRPAHRGQGQLTIDGREHLAVGDQIRAVDDRREGPLVDAPALKTSATFGSRSRIARA